jgi:hypothetical protein
MQEAETRDLRANQHTEGGKNWSRVTKKKTQEEDKKKCFVARGSQKTKHLLCVVEYYYSQGWKKESFAIEEEPWKQ